MIIEQNGIDHLKNITYEISDFFLLSQYFGRDSLKILLHSESYWQPDMVNYLIQNSMDDVPFLTQVVKKLAKDEFRVNVGEILNRVSHLIPIE